jgi:hypothetical protein
MEVNVASSTWQELPPRLTQINDVLFPVEERAVFASANGGDQKLPQVPDKKAIVDSKRHHVLGIVSQDYRLVTNREALDSRNVISQPFLRRPRSRSR